MSRPASLDVYYGEELVGRVLDAIPLAFEYAQTWLHRPAPFAMGAVPLQQGVHSTPQIQAFFENLLPEGELRQYIAEQKKASTLFSLIHEVAGDTAGAFVILETGRTPEKPSYQKTSWEELARKLGQQASAAMDLKGTGSRISLAGAQDKTTIALSGDGQPLLPKGASLSTHILKPDIKRLDKVWGSAANETLIMRTAQHCGLRTAEVFFEPQTHSCVVKRFDRFKRADGTLQRLVQYDLCQLGGTLSERKYEKEGGPSVVRCAELIRSYSSVPALDLRDFVEWLFFNLYVGNNDSHAKNLSLYVPPGGGARLTPFYDLMCTRLYPGLSREFAFAIGGEVQPGRVGRAQVEQLANELGFKPGFVLGIAAKLAQRLPPALAQAVTEVMPALNHSEAVLAEKLQHFVLDTTRKTAARMAASV